MGPLTGIRVIELAGIGPAPFAAMMLADMGADVVRVDRVEAVRPFEAGTPHPDVMNRGRRSIGVDLKTDAGIGIVLDLVAGADVLIEGFRPGVMERLGLGPDVCLARHPALVYGRMTGWGQTGPLAQRAGHDIDYIALTGVLEAIGRVGERPVPPLNLVGDFGGGGLMLAFGVVSALLAVRSGAAGQVIDAAIVDGAAALGTGIHGLRNTGLWPNPRGQNLLDGGAPFYDTYECADGRFLAVGALEPRFYAELVARAGLDDSYDRADRTTWPAQRAAWASVFRTRTRDAWAALLADSDACAAPVLDWDEAPDHPHMAARGVFVDHAGRRQPGPAPRLSGTPAELRLPPPHPGEHTDSILESIGRDPVALRAAGVVA